MKRIIVLCLLCASGTALLTRCTAGSSKSETRLASNDAGAYIDQGYRYFLEAEFDKAIKSYTRAIRLDPDNASAYLKRGQAYFRRWCRKWDVKANKDYDRAIERYTEMIRLNPGDADAYLKRGRAYGRKGDREKAEADFAAANKAVKGDGQNSHIYSPIYSPIIIREDNPDSSYDDSDNFAIVCYGVAKSWE